MTISMTNEVQMRERRHQLEDAADRYRQVRQHPLPRRAPLRAAIGRFLVRAGGRLAQRDPACPVPGHWATS